MATNEPVIYQTSSKTRLGHFVFYIIMGLVIAYFWNVIPEYRYAPIIAVFLVFIYTFGVHWFVQSRMFRALRILENGDADTAVAAMERIFAFFERHSWIDRYRSVVMMSSSAVSFREMALYNVAYIHLQAGKKNEAKAAFDRVLDQFPHSLIAKRSLKAFGTIEQPDGA